MEKDAGGVARAGRALVAMSGGVDSSVAAALMVERGFSCMGCTMRLYENDMVGLDLLDTCCSLKDTEDARAVAERLGIPYAIFHYENAFREKVIQPFVESYERGETPNPCIDCNRYMKFDSLYARAREMGYQDIVTGHYARIEQREGHYCLLKAKDPEKDQSYVLYDLNEAQLAHTHFPLGDYTKGEVRQIASRYGFANSHKKESQDICFVPDGDYPAMLRRFRGRDYPPGDFVDNAGNVLGRHRGIVCYTIGQRRGLGIPAAQRLYVSGLDLARNRVILSDGKDLFKKELYIRGFHWISGTPPEGPFRCKCKIRYRQQEQPAVVALLSDGQGKVTFDTAQRAITPGQSAVFYDGDRVLGGGIIDHAG